MAEWQDPQTFAIGLTIIFILVTALIISIIIFTKGYIKRIKQEQTKLTEIKIKYQKNLLKDSVLVQERERNRIAADLHDNLISKLHILKLSHHAKKPASQIDEMLTNSIEIARRISHDLSPPLIEETSLIELIYEITNSIQGSINIVFSKNNITDFEIPVEFKLQILRIIQEVIQNILKHAKATKIDINLRITKKNLAISVQDDGIGFDTSKRAKGLGTKNIELRTQLLKGTYRFKSEINKGTLFLLFINDFYKKITND